tara:strand:+ start:146 stop:388 length:243 start_codon:yes stop_codon:yes gene_type:complete
MARTKNKKEPMRTIKMSEKDFQKFIKYTNDLNFMLDSLFEMQDMYLSDIKALGDLKYDLTKAFNLNWNSDTWRYVEDTEE